MDVLFLVVDSLRAHPFADGRVADTPFLDALGERSAYFARAYSTECWTLPSHASMFTGLMPSQHRAHFHTMAYRGESPTLAEVMRERGYRTELVTRNFVFDGSIEGICRGFEERTRIVSDRVGWDPVAFFLAAAKPRFRRHVRNTGFFHPEHRDNRAFLTAFARALQPADHLLLRYLVEKMRSRREVGERSFVFANLYDVHAPYAPAEDSLLRPWGSWAGMRENLLAPFALSRLGEHRYLLPGVTVSEAVRRVLEERYRAAVERVDGLLAEFFTELDSAGLLEDTLVVLVSDHGEGFGEHGLFLHDASLFETHIHVPLWVMVPGQAACRIDDVVSTRHLFDLILGHTGGERCRTILDGEFRARHPAAFAQHYHYPNLPAALPQYRTDQFAAVTGSRKLLMRDRRCEGYDPVRDGDECLPENYSRDEARDVFAAAVGDDAVELRRWSALSAVAA